MLQNNGGNDQINNKNANSGNSNDLKNDGLSSSSHRGPLDSESNPLHHANNNNPTIQLSVSAEDGSLLTASLSTVIAAVCDELYDDIYNMTHGEIPVAINQEDTSNLDTSTHSPNPSNPSTGGPPNAASMPPGFPNFLSQQNNFQMQKMSSLSFAQRRHELGMRIARHSRKLFHLSALVSSYLDNNENSKNNGYSKAADCVRVASESLKHVRNAWIRADEAQDALYFSHGGLWRERRSCADIYGALDMICSESFSKLPTEKKTTPTESVDEDTERTKQTVESTNASTSARAGETKKLVKGGTWTDFPRGLGLQTDRYEGSQENARSMKETLHRLRGAVRRKLVLGEVGSNSQKDAPNGNLKWRVVLERSGGVVKLTHGTGKIKIGVPVEDNNPKKGKMFPIEARLTVLNEDVDAEWRLLSIEVNVHPRTGESSHQLEPSNRQKFDLHRLCEETMRREEEQSCQLLNKSKANAGGNFANTITTIPRPLNCLFNVAHAYATSLQMEMLSSQAEALRRGAWSNSMLYDDLGGGRNTTKYGMDGSGITVSPIHYFENEKDFAARWPSQSAPTSAMALHFWSCDDRHGTPQMGDLFLENDDKYLNDSNEKTENDGTSASSSATRTRSGSRNVSNYLPLSDNRGEKKLSLCFRSVPQRGIVVSLSGGINVMDILQSKTDYGNDEDSANTSHLRRNVEKLLSSILDPFQLSSSHALLYATVTCAHLRCVSVVQALLSCKSKSNNTSMNDNNMDSSALPSWIHLSVDCGTISVSIQMTYNSHNDENGHQEQSCCRPPFEAFRVACDSRTGKFVTLFPPEASLLRSLVCNDPVASEIQQYRTALLTPTTTSQSNKSSTKKKSISGSSNNSNVVSISRSNKELTGRIVRGMFESLSRSLNILGRRVGVGGDWNNSQDGEKLRRRAVENDCLDVKESLMSCCGVVAIFGTVSRALAIVTGTDAMADMAGATIEDIPNALLVPPVSVILKQQIVDVTEENGEEEPKKVSSLERNIFAVSGSVCQNKLSIHCFDVVTRAESPSSVPSRLQCIPVPLIVPIENNGEKSWSNYNRIHQETFDGKSSLDQKQRPMLDEVMHIVNIFDKGEVL